MAISPDGKDVYLTYDAFLTGWQSDTNNERPMQGVVRHASITDLDSWTTLHRGTEGDARGSSSNRFNQNEEFIGDYNSIVATDTSGIAVWNDVRRAADAPAIDKYRQSLVNGTPIASPNLETEVPSTFGNSDIFGGSFSDPPPPGSPSGLATSLGTSQSLSSLPVSTLVSPRGLATPLVTSRSLSALGNQTLTDSALALGPIPNVLPGILLMTPKGRKRSMSPPAVDVQLDAT